VDLQSALAVLEKQPGEWRPIAGGTDLMVLFEAGTLQYKKLLSLWHLEELRGVEFTEDFVSLGALTTYSWIRSNPVIDQEFPLLAKAAGWTGGIATQNRGTLGGNIANASPAADSPPALLVYDAEIELQSATASRWVPYASFHTAYKQTVMRPEELITRIRLPRGRQRWHQFTRKVGTRKAQAISKVCLAAAADMDGFSVRDVRIALGSVAPTVIRCTQTEAVLRGRILDAAAVARAKDAIASEIAPINDIRSTKDYRSRVTVNILEQFLRTVQFRTCCGSERWATAMADRHPFANQQQMLDAADEIWWSLAESDWLEAFATHPKIGEKPQHNVTAAEEQSGITGASTQVMEGLEKGNHVYLDRFGYIYIVFATGKSSNEMLALLQSRLNNEPPVEIRLAAAEQAKITRLRLQKLFQ
jgi:OHCU decarboxylase